VADVQADVFAVYRPIDAADVAVLAADVRDVYTDYTRPMCNICNNAIKCWCCSFRRILLGNLQSYAVRIHIMSPRESLSKTCNGKHPPCDY